MPAGHRATHSRPAAPLSRRYQPCSRCCQVPGEPAVPCWTGSAASAERIGDAAAIAPDPHDIKPAVPADAAGMAVTVVGPSGGGDGQPDARPRPGRAGRCGELTALPEAADRQRIQDGPQRGPASPRRATAHRVRSAATRPARDSANKHSMRDRPVDQRRAEAGDDAHQANVLAEPEDDVAARVERECAEQGIPVAIDDPVSIAKIITLVRAGRASKSATRAAKSARRGRPSGSAKGR
jgi:hypothetical protein